MTEIACSLDASEYRSRLADMAAVSQHALRAREAVPAGHRLMFASTEDVRARLRRIIDAEAACCAFLRFELREEAGELRLDVTGPGDALPIIESLFA